MSFLPYFLEESNCSAFDPFYGHDYLDIPPTRCMGHRQYCRPNPASKYYGPWQQMGMMRRVSPDSNANKNSYEVSLDVQQFRPSELSVKVVDNYVVVEGNHEERKDEHGFVSRQFKRRYVMPDNVNPSTVESTLSSDGVLTIFAPIKVLPTPANERAIPITLTNTPVTKPQMSGKGDATPQEKMDQ